MQSQESFSFLLLEARVDTNKREKWSDKVVKWVYERLSGFLRKILQDNRQLLENNDLILSFVFSIAF